MSLVSEILSVSSEITRQLHGESITVTDRDGQTQTITDAVVTIETPSVGEYGAGSARWSGSVLLADSWHAFVSNANLATVRGDVWNIVVVGQPFGGEIRIELRRDEQNHTNMTDLSNSQAVWGDT